MNNFELAIFEELESLCLMAIDAIEAAEQARLRMREINAELSAEKSKQLNRNDLTRMKLENCKLFRNLHSFLSCCASISKLMWLNSDRDISELKKKGISEEILAQMNDKLSEIRQKIELVDGKNCSLSNRNLRDHIEHFNERLFALIAITGSMSSFRVCNSAHIDQRAIGTSEKNYMRTFVTDTKEYIFQGEVFNLSQMELEIRALLKLIYEKHPLSWGMNPSL